MTAALVLLATALVVGPGALRARMRLAHPHGVATAFQAPTETGLLGVAFSFDVLAVCLRSGMPVASAALAVAPTAPPELARMLARAGEMLAVGSAPASAWSDDYVSGDSADTVREQCRALARLARRSADSGATMADGIAELAVRCRREAVDSATATAERAGVLIGAPLGLCFLPSFVCLGIVPVVMGLAGDVFGSGVL